MYSDGVTDQNYLRGVQVADSTGMVRFTSIFPACYDGRWPHIHFEVYPDQASITDSTSAIATSQVALPQDVVRAGLRDARATRLDGQPRQVEPDRATTSSATTARRASWPPSAATSQRLHRHAAGGRRHHDRARPADRWAAARVAAPAARRPAGADPRGVTDRAAPRARAAGAGGVLRRRRVDRAGAARRGPPRSGPARPAPGRGRSAVCHCRCRKSVGATRSAASSASRTASSPPPSTTAARAAAVRHSTCE